MDADTLQLLIGVGGGPIAVIALTNHLKLAVEWVLRLAPFLPGENNAEASPWPLVADLLGVLFALALWDSGVLPLVGLEVRWPVVVLIGLVVFGLGSSAVVDQKRSIVSRAQRPSSGGL